MRKNIIIIGCYGQVGQCVVEESKNFNCHPFPLGRQDLDVANSKEIEKTLSTHEAKIVLNCSAYTNVERSEHELEIAKEINHLAVENLAHACKKYDKKLIHISTDYVFNGESNIPYTETSKTLPIGVYGKTKREGELAIIKSQCEYVIVRTSWVFSEFGNNFLKTMLNLANSNDEISIVSDEIGCPTYARDLAATLLKIAVSDDKKINQIYHYCGDHPTSWYEFAKRIFFYAKRNNLKYPKKINKAKSEEFGSVKRPNYSVLNCEKICKEYDVKLSNWDQGIKKALYKIESS